MGVRRPGKGSLQAVPDGSQVQMRVRSEMFGWTSPQSNENPPPATTTVGLPVPVQ
ncbi:MAG TPA: hypothetical protein VHC90_00350 [Bryobacteraceae bacterium]|nr:hypothetical protein [Bryobacteraceae bacterium]